MKLLVDMNLSPRWVETLAASGIEAEHWSSIGIATASDAQIMAHAAAEDCVVLTHDLDFGSILAATKGRKPTVIQLRSDDTSPERVGPLLVAAVQQCEAELAEGALLTVDVARVRLSLLPLRT